MATDLPPGLLDCPPAYGFAVSAVQSDGGALSAPRHTEDGDLSERTSEGVTIVVRRYAATPESVDEPQPVASRDIILAYEGRVDNREEIAYTLGTPRLAHEPDGAVLAAAYAAWGPGLSAKTVGEFAYVVYDGRSPQLVAGQDSLGVRRIFYCATGSRILITSNLGLLFERFPETRPSYDREVLREYFTGTMSPRSGRTVWRGVRELGRGNVLVQRGDQLEERTVWRPNPDRRDRFTSAEDVDDAFRKHLFDAVRPALRSAGPLLCDLSGGYDSSTICAVAARLIQAGVCPGPLISWSVVNERSNESTFQEAVRRQCQIEGQTLDMARYPAFQCFTDTEIPTGRFVQMGARHRAAREFTSAHGIRSRLTGHAADALLQKLGGGSPVYLSEWFRERRFRDWARHYGAYLKSGSYNAWQLMRECTVGTLDLHVGLRAPMPDWLTPEFQREIKQAQAEFLHGAARAFRSDARERVYRWTLCFIPYTGGALPDQRVPFAHRPLVEFLLGLDWDHLVAPNDDRLLMRRSLRGILPEIVRSGQRCWTAFGASLHEGLRAAWPKISQMVTGEQLAELGVVERRPFRAALEAMRAGYEGPNGQFTRTALYLETWLGMKAMQDR